MDLTELDALVMQVLGVGGLFGGLAHLLMEVVVKPLTRKMPHKARKQSRFWLARGLPVLMPIIYLVATHAMPWNYAPHVIALALGSSWLNHWVTKKNDAKDA